MINFSFSSVLMTVILCSLLLIVMAFCLNAKGFLTNVGYKLIFAVCTLILLRLLIPFELPFTKTLRIPKVLSDVLIVFTRSYGTFMGIDISFGTIFCAIWLLGSLIFIARYIYDHKRLHDIARLHSSDVTGKEPYAAILSEICTEEQRKRIRVYSTPHADTPMVMGLRNPIILLPTDMEVSVTDITYALRHEICHCAHHDLWIKLMIDIISMIYWWNPLTYVWGRQLNAALEMRVDDALLSEENVSLSDYLSSLLQHIKGTDLKKKNLCQPAGLTAVGKSTLHYRLQMIKNRDHRPNRLLNVAVFAITFSAYILSYFYIWEVNYAAPEIEESCVLASDSEVYAIATEDGRYEIYFNDVLMDTIDTLQYYSPDMKIYTSEEEYHEKEF